MQDITIQFIENVNGILLIIAGRAKNWMRNVAWHETKIMFNNSLENHLWNQFSNVLHVCILKLIITDFIKRIIYCNIEYSQKCLCFYILFFLVLRIQ